MMDEETVLETEEVSDPGTQPATAPDETEAAATGDGTVMEEDNEISETVADIPSEESVLEDGTESTEEIVLVVTPEHIQDAALTISGSVLFGAFLIAGILIAFRIMRVKDHG